MGSHRCHQLQFIVFDSELPQRLQAHQLLSKPIAKVPPTLRQQGIAEGLTGHRHHAAHLAWSLQSQHLAWTQPGQIHLNRSAADLGMLQRQPLEAHIPGRQHRPLQPTTHQTQGRPLQCEIQIPNVITATSDPETQAGGNQLKQRVAHRASSSRQRSATR